MSKQLFQKFTFCFVTNSSSDYSLAMLNCCTITHQFGKKISGCPRNFTWANWTENTDIWFQNFNPYYKVLKIMFIKVIKVRICKKMQNLTIKFWILFLHSNNIIYFNICLQYRSIFMKMFKTTYLHQPGKLRDMTIG